jgi:radical SAM protein with 4Fe4S-binding SPASM domain
MLKNQSKEYKKHNSFVDFKTKTENKISSLLIKIDKILSNPKNLNHINNDEKNIIKLVQNDLKENIKKSDLIFKLSSHVADEINTFDREEEIVTYLVHRYRYEIFPNKNIIDKYPPYLQIEPSSICNYRCVFCFETDVTFTNKKNGYMGTMNLDLFKNIVDQAENKIQFISIASRGEPLVCKDIDKMLEYTVGKFLNLKINTNASLLNEKKIHSILKGGVKTLVFSADAADEKLYSELRVNGNLKTVVKNIELFNKIKNTQYPKNKIITRVSGVKFNKEQKIESMNEFWNDLVDQVAFVDYNPWENIYEKEESKITKPCSDLWRRMFVWWDGKVNPCDSDYKSVLTTGNIKDNSLSELWLSQKYQDYRSQHLNNQREKIFPCKNCVVT